MSAASTGFGPPYMPDASLRDAVLEAIEADWIGFFEEVCGVRWVGEPRLRRAHGCGFHEDRHASFSIYRGETGRLRWKCHAACGGGDVFDAYQRARGLPDGQAGFKQALHELAVRYGLRSADAPSAALPGVIRGQPPPVAASGSRADSGLPEGAQIAATYGYQDEAGVLLYEVLRYEWIDAETGKKEKTFRQVRPAGPDDPPGKQWVWSTEGVRRVPYRLQDLLRSTQTLFVVEGEKDVGTWYGFGFPPAYACTCICGGATAWLPDYARFFEGRDVVFIPDADEAGEKFLREAAKDLAPVAKRFRVLRFPRGEKDLTDWVEAGGTAELFKQLVVREAKPWEQPEEPEPLDQKERADPNPGPSSPECPFDTSRVDPIPTRPEPAPDSDPPRPDLDGPTPGSAEDPLLPIFKILQAGGDPRGRLLAAQRALVTVAAGTLVSDEQKPPQGTIQWGGVGISPEKPGGVNFITPGPNTGLNELDSLLYGIRPAWYVVEGESGFGKSTFVNQIVQHTIEEGTAEGLMQWLVIPLEEGPEAWRIMMLARLTGVDGARLATLDVDALTPDERQRVARAWALFVKIQSCIAWPHPDIYLSGHGIGVSDVLAMIEEFQAAIGGEPGAGLGGVVIDPLHTLARISPDEREYDFAERSMVAFRAAQIKWRIPLVVNVHLNREGKVKGSSGFEFRADVRLKLHVGEEAKRQNGTLPVDDRELEPYIDCDILKNKNLPTGRAILRYDRRISTFYHPNSKPSPTHDLPPLEGAALDWCFPQRPSQ